MRLITRVISHNSYIVNSYVSSATKNVYPANAHEYLIYTL